MTAPVLKLRKKHCLSHTGTSYNVVAPLIQLTSLYPTMSLTRLSFGLTYAVTTEKLLFKSDLMLIPV